MNYFVEGLQGSGKSTMVKKIAFLRPGCRAVMEGDYSPVELSWCACTDRETYRSILDRYPGLRGQIEKNTYDEDGKKIICYTKVAAPQRAFYADLEQYEIYNNRVPFDQFRSIILERYRRWDSDGMIFECALFQNIVEDMLLFRQAADEEILAFYDSVREALDGREYRIIYLKSDNIAGNLEVIRKERSDEQGREVWFPMMLDFFNTCPLARARGLKGEEDLIRHFAHRQDLEMRIIREIFPDRAVVLRAKDHTDEDIRTAAG